MVEPSLVLVAGLDAVLRDVAVAGLLCDLPEAVAVGYDLDDRGTRLRATVHRRSGVLESEDTLLDGDCLGCLVAEDVALRVAGAAGSEARIVTARALNHKEINAGIVDLCVFSILWNNVTFCKINL